MKTQQGQGKQKKRRWLIPLIVLTLAAIGGAVYTGLFLNRLPIPETLKLEESSTLSPTTSEQPATTDGEKPEATQPNHTSSVGPENPPVGNKVGQTAPGFTLKDLGGKRVSLSDFRGHVVILDFWASWCNPCRSSMPKLETLRARYQEEGLMMLGVSLDRSAEDAATYLEANGYTEVITLWESLGAAQGVARSYGVSGIPRTFIIDRYGIIRYSGHPLRLTSAAIEPWLK